MTVHCVKVMAATDVDVQNTRNKIADLKSKYGEKVPEDNRDFTQGQTSYGEVSFYRATFRVSLSDSNKVTEKDDLTEQIRKEMDKSASWWQVKWHECDHDTQDSDCGWSYKNDSGNVPTEVAW